MNKTIIILLTFYLHFSAFSQGLINNATNFYLSANSNLILSGNANLINNATMTCATNSNVKFTGSFVDQYIGGTTTTTFYNLYINKQDVLAPGNIDLYLQQNVVVSGTIFMQLGHLNLRDKQVNLGTTGMVSGENIHSRIRATDASKNEGAGTGIIRAQRDNPSGNVAGLGLDFTPVTPLGNDTRIIRGCNALQGSGSFTGNYSIFRWYRILPGSTMSDLTINNFYYWGGTPNPELNGHTEDNLQMFQWVQYGAGNPQYWEPRHTTVNTSSDYVQSTTRSDISLLYILVTLGSTDKPLPVEYLSFSSTCNGNTNRITWETASESNNYGFVIEKSPDAYQWEYIGFVSGQGNSNTTTTYHFTDNHPFYPITYYRLLQTDYNGAIKPSNIVSANCINTPNYTEDIIPLPNDHMLNFFVQGNPDTHYRIYITNVIGQTIYQQKISLTEPLQHFQIEQPFAIGIYYINMIGNNTYISKPFVIQK